LPGLRLTSLLCPSVTVPPLRSGLLSLSFHSVLLALLPLPALLPCLPAPLQSSAEILLSVHALLPSSSAPQRDQWRGWPRAFYRPAGRRLPAATQITSFGSWFLLPALTVAKVSNPFGDVGVVRNQPAIRFVVLQSAFVIPKVQVAQNRKILVRIVKVGELRKGRLITSARLRKFSFASLHQAELVVGGGVVWIQFQRPFQASFGVVQVAGVRVCDPEIDVRCRRCGRLF